MIFDAKSEKQAAIQETLSIMQGTSFADVVNKIACYQRIHKSEILRVIEELEIRQST
jgi:hypothetical protein